MSRARPLDDRRVFIAARRVPRDRRDAFVAKVCRENAELRARVEQLLAAAEQPSVFIRPPTGVRGFVADGPGATSTTARAKRHPPLAAGTRIAERYLVESTIGEGSSGRVYRGTDGVLKTTVAIKVLDLEAGAELEQLRREAATLRWLRVPGVVNLQDDGVDEGRPYIVTDLVEGAPFPGSPTTPGPRRWEDIRETAVGVLETLARIHAQGVIHGDLKPANVLVDAKGIPTVLDVGIASGPSIDFGESETLFAGTPSYMAPERIAGGPATVSTDLYAVGVMLHHALLGEVPHQAATRTRLFDRRRNDPVEPLRTRAPEVPPDAARMIDALLARDPKDRPASAYDALDLLEHLRYVRPGNPEYPWLGSRELIDKLVQAAQDGRSMDIWGPPGSGKTRTLREAAKEIEALGRKVEWIPSGGIRPGSPADRPTRAESPNVRSDGLAHTASESRLLAYLASGIVFILDDSEGLDAVSTDLFSRYRSAGVVLRAASTATREAHGIPRLLQSDLEPLFQGRNRVFHLPEDASRSLLAQSGGMIGAVLERASSWVRAGLATWSGDRLTLTREALARLETPAIPPSEHLDRASTDTKALASPAESESPEHFGVDPNRVRRLAESLREAVRLKDLAAVERTAGTLLAVALLRGSLADVEFVRHQALLGRLLAPILDWIERIATAAESALRGRVARVFEILDGVPENMHPALRRCAESVRVFASRSRTIEDEERVIRDAAAWITRHADSAVTFPIADWQGWLRYRQARFVEAAELHKLHADSMPPDSAFRAASLLASASASMEAGRYGDARARSLESRALAAAARAPLLELRAEWLLRSLLLRRDEPATVDDELVECARNIGHPANAARVFLTEATIAWRSGDPRRSTALAAEAIAGARLAANEATFVLAYALANHVAGEAQPSEAHLVVETALRAAPPGVAVQVIAMLAHGLGDHREPALEAARRVLSRLDPQDNSRRREILSINECIAFMNAAANRNFAAG